MPESPGNEVRQQRKSCFCLFWTVLCRCGSFLIVLGSLGVVVGRFGSFWVVPRFSDYEIIICNYNNCTNCNA